MKLLIYFLLFLLGINDMAIAYNYQISSISTKRLDISEYELLKKMIITDKNNKTFESTFTVYSKGDMKDGKHTGVKKEVKFKSKLYFKKPLKALLKVIDTPDLMAKGSTLLYTGGEKIKVKAGGLLSIFTVSFDINSTMFQNTRGHNLLMTLDGLNRLNNPKSKLKIKGIGKIEERDVYILEVDAFEKPDSEITKEVFYVDTENYIVLCSEMYDNNELVLQYKLDYIKTNIDLNDGFFKI